MATEQSTEKQSRFNKAIKDPKGMYGDPSTLLADNALSREEKIQILRQWEYDARDLEVASEENMAGEDSSMLQRVTEALRTLGVEKNVDIGPPTKQGG